MADNKAFLILNHLLLLFKYYVYEVLKKFKPSFFCSPREIHHESILAEKNSQKKSKTVKVLKRKEHYLQKNGKRL